MGETVSVLPGRSVIAVSGADRARFLDGLLSCEVEALQPGSLAYGALLTPQGKVVADMMVFCEADRIALDVPEGAADELARRLAMYKLRAAVDVARTDEVVLVGDGDGDGAGDGSPDPRASGLGLRAIAPGGSRNEAALANYAKARIAAGVPDAVVDFPLGDTFPHDANMDLTGAVDFAKGCFVGQEVVSRMRHRGTARRRTVIVEGEAALPATGTALTVAGKEVGRLGTVEGRDGLAMVRIDKLGRTAEAGGVALSVRVPSGAPFTLADAEPTV